MNLLALAVVTVNISSGEAALQLNEFGTQTGAQLLFNFEDLTRYRTNAVQGTMDIFVVLDRMIEGTPLSYDYVNGRTVAITANPVPTARAVDDELTITLIADECSFGLIPAHTASQELGDVPHACWCCVHYAGPLKEASCISLPSQDACSVYDARPHLNFWSSAVTTEVVVSGVKAN